MFKKILQYIFAPRPYSYMDERAGVTEFEIKKYEIKKKNNEFTDWANLFCKCGHTNAEHQRRAGMNGFTKGCYSGNCKCKRFNYDETKN